ncbi:MAG: M3 family peptidase [Bacteroidetes bacterium]|nr:MAG: M3 family peptidase [Bacteroidota bacterium]
MNNPLLSEWKTPFETPPFSSIENNQFLPAIKESIAASKKEIEAIKTNTSTANFENTIEALEESGKLLSRVSSIFFNLHSAESNDELRNLAQEISPLLTQHGNDILLDEMLFGKVKYVHDHTILKNLSSEQQMLLEKSYKGFVRNGALLNKKDKTKLRKIDEKLSKIKLDFGNHVLAETQQYEKHISDKQLLAGIPEYALASAAEEAKKKKKDGWIFTLDFPSYSAVMKYAENRELRKEIYTAFNSKAFKSDELDNKKIVLEIARLRNQRARLLGYPSHAKFILEERMSKNPEKVKTFLSDLLEKAKPVAEAEMQRLKDFAVTQGADFELQSYDTSFYSEKLKQSLFNVDDEVLKPYFKLETVLEGAFETAELLYGITFTERFDIDKYHDEVKTFEVKDREGKHLAVFYADFFPRSGKRGGAWMTSFSDQYVYEGKDHRPQISIVCNFNRPTKTTPSLLTFNEVTTLFHEFGHALHGMLSRTHYASLSGTHVYWDFVELPSQIMENWCFEKENLDRFAKHFETGELIPTDLIDGIKNSANFMEASATMRQLSFGLLDMAWHAEENDSEFKEVTELEEKAIDSTRLLPKIEGTNVSCQFSHIFQGGYSSGYYSYKWAEVLDADAFEYFKEKGIFNSEVASKFQKLLESGGTVEPMELYKQFRGKEPDAKALLKRAGILKS